MPDCWTVYPDGSLDFAFPAPSPTPFTTIAWRMGHVIVGVFATRKYHHFGGPPASYQSWDYATDAATALRQFDLATPRGSPGCGRFGGRSDPTLRPV